MRSLLLCIIVGHLRLACYGQQLAWPFFGFLQLLRPAGTIWHIDLLALVPVGIAGHTSLSPRLVHPCKWSNSLFFQPARPLCLDQSLFRLCTGTVTEFAQASTPAQLVQTADRWLSDALSCLSPLHIDPSRGSVQQQFSRRGTLIAGLLLSYSYYYDLNSLHPRFFSTFSLSLFLGEEVSFGYTYSLLLATPTWVTPNSHTFPRGYG
jgi:hypothetical protein